MKSPQRFVLSVMLALSLFLSGCATIEDLVGSSKKGAAPTAEALQEREPQDPIDANTFTLAHDGQSMVGEPQVVFTTGEDTFSDLARAYGLGYDDIVDANPGINPWLPGTDTAILLPTQYVLPAVPNRGIILNIAAKRLFYFPPQVEGEPQKVLTYPIGIGRVGWETPLGDTKVIAKAKDPSWWVPASVRREHAELGDPLPAVVPPGPDNPLGHRVLKLDMPGYLIHGTNQPYGVGMRVSHGCVRLYPENIEYLYTLVGVGEGVTIVNEPYQFGARDGHLYFEAHAPLEDDAVVPTERLQALLDAKRDDVGRPLADDLRDIVIELSATPNGVPSNVSMYGENEVLNRVRVVHNVVERSLDEPTLEEIREMMEEMEAEVEAEAASL